MTSHTVIIHDVIVICIIFDLAKINNKKRGAKFIVTEGGRGSVYIGTYNDVLSLYFFLIKYFSISKENPEQAGVK